MLQCLRVEEPNGRPTLRYHLGGVKADLVMAHLSAFTHSGRQRSFQNSPKLELSCFLQQRAASLLGGHNGLFEA